MAPSVHQEFHCSKHISNGTIRHYLHETPMTSELPSIPKPALAPGRIHAMALQSASYSETHYSCRGDSKGQETSSISSDSISSTSISATSVSTSLLSSLSPPPAVASFPSPCPSNCPIQPSIEPTALESNTSTATTTTAPPDAVQHCLLFPTYATRHSRSGSKDPDDWNVRVRGWAFSKRSNRRKRLVMSMARKIAGVTKDSNQQVYETLESRFGMFLASNTHGAQFSIHCVGPVHGPAPSSITSTSSYLTHMELAGGSGTGEAAVDSLLDELRSVQDEDEFLDEEDVQVAKEKDPIAKVMESNAIYDQYQASIQSKSSLAEHIKRALEAERVQKNVATFSHPQGQIGSHKTEQQVDLKLNTDRNLESVTRFSSKEDETYSASAASSFSDKVSRGAALLKGAIQKYKKPAVMSDLSNNTSVDTLKLPPFSQPSTRTSSNISDMSTLPDESSETNDKSSVPRGAVRVDSGDSDTALSTSSYEDLDHGNFPTVQISSRPGGHFDGTLRVGHGMEDS